MFFASYYDHYLDVFYKKNSTLATKSYHEQLKALEDDYFGVFASYTKYINRQDAEAQLIIPNCKPLQKTWAKENNVKFEEKNWRFDIPIAQVKKYKPDIFFLSSMFEYYGGFLEEVRKYVSNIFGWIACPIPYHVKIKQVDLLLTSVPAFVDNFRGQGVNAELLSQAFDADIFQRIPAGVERNIDFSFIGNLTRAHSRRVQMIERLFEKTPLQFFGTGLDLIPDKRNFFQKIISKRDIEKRSSEAVWGLEMYKTLYRSKITFNAHIDVSGNFAGNMRMYEATGMGTLLLTDGKDDEIKVFNEEEVVFYTSIEEAIEKVYHYLKNEDERKMIASKGQKKTFDKYNYEVNSAQMLSFFRKYCN